MSLYNADPEAGYQALELRFQTVTRIIEILNANLPVESKVREMGQALGELLPFDRFSLGLLWANRWYILDDEGLHVEEIYRTRFESDDFSATRWVISSQTSCFRPDISDERRFEYDETLVAEGIRSDLVVPLVADDHVIGTFNFASRTAGAYSEAQCQSAESIASAVAAVVRLLQDQLFLDGLREISEAVQGTLDLDIVLQMMLTHIRSQGYDRVRVYLYDEVAYDLVGAVQAGGEVVDDFEGFRIPIDKDVYSRVIFKGRRARIYKFGELGRGWRKQIEKVFDGLDYREKAELPLFVVEDGKDRIVGKITVDNGLSDNPLLQDRLDALMLYASQAAIAIRHAQLYQRLEQEVADRTVQLRESELRFRRLSEATFEGIVISENGVILDVNEQYCNMLGYAYDEMIGRAVLTLVVPEMQARVHKYITEGYEDPYESAVVRANGTVFPIEVRGRNISLDGRAVRVTAIRDISEQKNLEQERILLERTSALGELAQGVAHNFNNLLVG
ncbi:MAG: PAS domain S-box protein, partial [Candidatus Latescibacteria bacterium]|nr:PAS domain S-box protein [Candidatus Latescibacterota bacterium]